MSNPLARYFNRIPTAAELSGVAQDELARIVEAAKATEQLDADDLRQTREWARELREAAERALASRDGK